MSRKKLTPTQKERRQLQRAIRSDVKELNRQLAIMRRHGIVNVPNFDTVQYDVASIAKKTGTKATKFHTGRVSHMSLENLRAFKKQTAKLLNRAEYNTTKRRAITKTRRAELTANIRAKSALLNEQVAQINAEGLKYGGFSETVKRELHAAGTLAGTKNAKKFATGNLSKMSLSQLERLSHRMNATLKQKSFSEEGRREMYEKRFLSFNAYMRSMVNGREFTKDEYDAFVSLMGDQEDALQQFYNNENIPSDLIIEAIKKADKGRNILQQVVDAHYTAARLLFSDASGNIDRQAIATAQSAPGSTYASDMKAAVTTLMSNPGKARNDNMQQLAVRMGKLNPTDSEAVKEFDKKLQNIL